MLGRKLSVVLIAVAGMQVGRFVVPAGNITGANTPCQSFFYPRVCCPKYLTGIITYR